MTQTRPTIEDVLRSPTLPSLPTAAAQIVSLVERDEVTFDELASVIASDPALTSKILRTANSSAFARQQRVTRLHKALMVLGLRNVKTLALGFSLVADLRGREEGSFDYNHFWQRSLLAAVGARETARRAGIPQSEEAFLGGLLHAIGVLALVQAVGEPYRALFATSRASYRRLLAMERQELGFDHTDVGEELARQWNLPPVLSACIGRHRTADASDDTLRPVVRCVSLGITLAEVAIGHTPGESLAEFHARARMWFGMDPDTSDTILEAVLVRANELRNLVSLPAKAALDVDDILSRAHNALVELSLEVAEENIRLEEATRDLASRANTDALTGLANRAHLDEFLEAQFQIASRYGTPLSVLLIDLDEFKRVNDTYGHVAGDRILQAVASTVATTVRKADFVARYGGEELAVVLPATDMDGALELAERVRTAIEDVRVVIPGEAILSITASVGAAEVSGSHGTASDLLTAADQAMYLAKRAGRNCVHARGIDRDAA